MIDLRLTGGDYSTRAEVKQPYEAAKNSVTDSLASILASCIFIAAVLAVFGGLLAKVRK